jgi:hypothetical protein
MFKDGLLARIPKIDGFSLRFLFFYRHWIHLNDHVGDAGTPGGTRHIPAV